MDLGLLLLRLILAALLFGHASQKLLGWFGGQGARATATAFENWGLRPGLRFVILASVSEFFGAALIAAGALFPLGSAVVVGTMTVAIAFNFPHGLWAHKGGYEVALVYALIAVVLATTGPGSLAVDNAAGLAGLDGPAWGAAAALAGVLAAFAGPLAMRRSGRSKVPHEK